MAEFPTSIPTHTAPSAGQKLNNPSQVDIVTKLQQEQVAISTKLGTGSSTPASGKLLRGTGAGTSSFDKDAPTGDIVGTTDTQELTNKTIVAPTLYQDAGKTKQMSLPNTASDTLVSLAATQTLINKTLTSPLFQGSIDGWISANETWTYASATTITVPSGAASKYPVGAKIKLTQTTVKYFYVVAVADTLLTVTGGSDYTLANAAITANYYSHATSPVGFPANSATFSPLGVAYAETTTQQTGITNADLTSLAITVTVPTGKRIKIVGDVFVSSTVNGDAINLRIQEGSTVLQTREMILSNVAAQSLIIEAIISPTPGSHTYKLVAERSIGSGTISSIANSTAKPFIMAEIV